MTRSKENKDAKLETQWIIKRHEYDIDVFEILDQLRKKVELRKINKKRKGQELDFLDAEEFFFVSDMRSKKCDLTKEQKIRHYILPSTSNSYYSYLGMKLLVIDIYRIEAVLTFQAPLFKGNYYAEIDNFLGLVEFIVFNYIKQSIFLDVGLRLEKIMNWVERNRNPSDNENYFNNDMAIGFRPYSIEETFAVSLCSKLHPYFSKDQHNKLHEAIAKGNIVRGLVFNGNARSFVELFKRLRYNKKIIVKKNEILTRWIVDVFRIKDDHQDLKELNYDTALQVLRKTDHEPPKKNRILDDFVSWIAPSHRKDQILPSR